MSGKQGRWDEIRKIQIESASAYRILGGLVLVGFGVWLGANLFAGDAGYGTNLYTEFISIAVTVLFIDNLNRRRDDRRRKQELAERLLREARSPDTATAQNAFHQMKDLELIYGKDSILRGADLRSIRPGNVDLTGANMEGAKLAMADFSNCTFDYANLEGAKLSGADLTHSCLDTANLENADMEGAKLTHANLVGAHLSGANLLNANANRAYLSWSQMNLKAKQSFP